MTALLRGATALLTAGAASGLLAACGGGFGSTAPVNRDQSIHHYVALGDDFTAAPGAGSAATDDGCRRSDTNYPALLAQDLQVGQVTDVSCAGATTQNLTDKAKPAKGKPKVPAQLDSIGKDTDLVTIGVGIADRGLLTDAFRVCTALPCAGKVTPQAILDDVQTMADALTAAIRAIQDRAPDAYIVLVGYPDMMPTEGTCDALPNLDQSGLDTARTVFDSINHQIRATARGTGAAYADVSEMSVGHELCSGDPWVTAAPGRDGAISFRPAPAEQRAAADAIAELVKSR